MEDSLRTNNKNDITSDDGSFQNDAFYSGNGSDCNQNKDKPKETNFLNAAVSSASPPPKKQCLKNTLNNDRDNIHAGNMAKINYNQGTIHIGGTQYTINNNNPTCTRDSSPGVPDEKLDPSKIFEDLPEVLFEDAKETLDKFDSSDDQTFSLHTGYVPLQISLFQQNNKTNTPGHLHTRQEIMNSHKTDSKILKPEKFFENAENFIRGSDCYKKIHSENKKENFLYHKSKLIGVIGQAGVGKSTLIKNLFQQFVDKRQLYQAIYVIKINLRDFYDKSEISLFQFLLGENVYGFNEWTKSESICTKVYKLLTDCESVCILLDGLDEAKLNVEDKVDVNASNFLKQKPGNFLLALLSG